MEILLILAMFIGLLNAYKSIRDVRLGITTGVKPSKADIDFVFLLNK